jgi:2-phospho-L-lactate guanylyltransferase
VRLAVVIPVKSFTVAKGRLADVLSPAGREVLARQCADTVVRAAAPARAYVVCNDESIAEWARAAGATVVGQTTPGLNGAVRDGWDAAVSDGADHIVIAHADLPLAASFAHVPRGGSVSVVPDRHRDGTNVMSLPAAAQFDLHYGPGSFAAHAAEAQRRGLEFVIIEDGDLALDLDTADDLDELQRRRNDTMKETAR